MYYTGSVIHVSLAASGTVGLLPSWTKFLRPENRLPLRRDVVRSEFVASPSETPKFADDELMDPVLVLPPRKSATAMLWRRLVTVGSMRTLSGIGGPAWKTLPRTLKAL